MTRALYQKEHNLTDRSDVIFEAPKCSKIKFLGARAPLGELTVRAYIAPRPPTLTAAVYELVAKSS